MLLYYKFFKIFEQLDGQRHAAMSSDMRLYSAIVFLLICILMYLIFKCLCLCTLIVIFSLFLFHLYSVYFLIKKPKTTGKIKRVYVAFLWNFLISREAATAERRYEKERQSVNYMHTAAFSARTKVFSPLPALPLPLSHPQPINAIRGAGLPLFLPPPPHTP